MADRIFMVCVHRTARLVLSEPPAGPTLQVVGKDLHRFYLTAFGRVDREFPQFTVRESVEARTLGDHWTLCTEVELVALRLLGKIDIVETGE